jgi:hypothetical protein
MCADAGFRHCDEELAVGASASSHAFDAAVFWHRFQPTDLWPSLCGELYVPQSAEWLRSSHVALVVPM